MKLEELTRAITEMVAMSADEHRIGTGEAIDAYREVDEWYDAINAAIDDGLEAAYKRADETYRKEEL